MTNLWSFCFAMLMLFAPSFLMPQVCEAERPPILYFENEVVVDAKGPWCPWAPGVDTCAEALPAGIHLIKWQVGAESVPTRKIIPLDKQSDYICNQVAPNKLCEPNIFFKTVAVPGAPNDPLYPEQWALPFISAPYAWDKATGEKPVIILDTGTECNHPDIECLPGYDAINDKENWYGTDGNGHGSHCSSIACSPRNNAVGVSGIGNCRVIPIRVLGDSGGGSLYTVAKGFDYVASHYQNGILSASLGAYFDSEILRNAVVTAQLAGITIVAAAGNDNKNIDVEPHYPSSYPGVIAVGALRETGDKAGYSNFGERVNTWAPGSNILAAYKGGYQKLSGSSMATPLVAGTISLTGNKLPGHFLDAGCMADGIDCDAEPSPPSENCWPCQKLKDCYKKCKSKFEKPEKRQECRVECREELRC